MGTVLFIVLHFLGYTNRPDEWYTLCYLVSLDTISVAIALVGWCQVRCRNREGGRHE
jgi:hypothetical protein